ncbi:MAG: FAD-binding domain-containing protein, partial [Pseudomonadota bacterium]
VQMQSGTTGINTIRIYNPVKQGHDQDPNGIFIKRWVPELAGLESPLLHEPWGLNKPVEGYPSIMVDHQQSAREARERIWSVRKEKGFGNAAREVLEKHSSRKSVRQPDHVRRRKRGPDPAQIRFDF